MDFTKKSAQVVSSGPRKQV